MTKSLSRPLALAFCFAAVSNASGESIFPLQVAASGRHLEGQRGQPFFVNGEAAWSITHNLTYDEVERYLDDRLRRGFNALMVSVPDAYGPDGQATHSPDRQGNQPFIDDDISRPNEAYWRHVDRVLARAEEKGFLVLYWPFYLGCCNDGYMTLFLDNGIERARAYGRFVGRRYRDRKNLVWVHGGDHDPGTAKGLKAALKDWLYSRGHNPAGVRDLVVAVKSGIAETAAGTLHAGHWAPETDPYVPYGESFADLYTSYTYGPVAAAVSRHYDHRPIKPVILIETHYENDFGGRTAADVRRYPYRAVLSGAAGHFFGNKPLWFSGHGWEQALGSPGSQSMEHVGRLFRSRPWERLVPEPAGRLVAAGGGDPRTDEGVQLARASDASFAMAFVPDSRSVEIDLRRLSGPTIRASWFDIVTGSRSVVGDFPPTGRRTLTPPTAGGSVLVLDDTSRGFPPPGASNWP